VDKLTTSFVSTRGPPPKDGSRLGPGSHVERFGNKNTPTAGKNFVLPQAISRCFAAADGTKRRAVLLLQSRPLNLDVLQLVIVLLAFFPFVLALMLRWPTFTMAGSLVLYLAARRFGFSLPAYPAGTTYLNPFCWQLLFVLGAYFALSGAKLVRSMQELWTVRILAFSYLAFALVVTLAGRDPTLGSLVPDVVTRAFIPTDRENLGPSTRRSK
jgi:hypothetical protein